MRLKTDARREAIVAVATELFREVGFQRASMAEIAARLGGSKTTLYSYFKSKEELFAAAMVGAVEEQGQTVIDLLDSNDEDMTAVLCRFGEAYLRMVTSTDVLAVTRTAISEGGNNSTLGAELYEIGPKRAWLEVSTYIRERQKRGSLDSGDPYMIACHFKGMLESQILEPLLWGARASADHAAATGSAVQALLAAYKNVHDATFDNKLGDVGSAGATKTRSANLTAA